MWLKADICDKQVCSTKTCSSTLIPDSILLCYISLNVDWVGQRASVRFENLNGRTGKKTFREIIARNVQGGWIPPPPPPPPPGPIRVNPCLSAWPKRCQRCQQFPHFLSAFLISPMHYTVMILSAFISLYLYPKHTNVYKTVTRIWLSRSDLWGPERFDLGEVDCIQFLSSLCISSLRWSTTNSL